MSRCIDKISKTIGGYKITAVISILSKQETTFSINQSISAYLVPRLHKSGPTRHYKCHHSTRIVKTSAVIKAHIKKMILEFPFESSSAVG